MDFFKSIFRKLPKKDALLGQLWRYGVTGGLAFAVDFGLFSAFLYGFGVHYLLANLAGLVGGLAVNYAISVGWVFSACKRNFESRRGLEILLFAVVGVIGMGLNQLLMWLFVGVGGFPPMLSKIVSAVIVLLWNFLGRKVLLFKEGKISI